MNITPVHISDLNDQNNNDESEQLRIRQERIRLENDAEKERNRRIIHDLITIKSSSQSVQLSANSGLLRKSFLCQICQKSASITERIRFQGFVYHRECMRCCKCNSVVKNPENSRYDEKNVINFYCSQHSTLQNEDLRTLSKFPLEFDVNKDYTPQVKCVIDTELIRQKALEKARLKSDEELGIKITPRSIEIVGQRKKEKTQVKDLLEKAVSNADIKLDCSKMNFESRTDFTDSDRDVSEENESKNEDDLLVEDEMNEVTKKMALMDFDLDLETNRNIGLFNLNY